MEIKPLCRFSNGSSSANLTDKIKGEKAILIIELLKEHTLFEVQEILQYTMSLYGHYATCPSIPEYPEHS